MPWVSVCCVTENLWLIDRFENIAFFFPWVFLASSSDVMTGLSTSTAWAFSLDMRSSVRLCLQPGFHFWDLSLAGRCFVLAYRRCPRLHTVVAKKAQKLKEKQRCDRARVDRPGPARSTKRGNVPGIHLVVYTWESEERIYVLSLTHETIRAKIFTGCPRHLVTSALIFLLSRFWLITGVRTALVATIVADHSGSGPTSAITFRTTSGLSLKNNVIFVETQKHFFFSEE